MTATRHTHPAGSRQALRQHLLAQRELFAASPQAVEAQSALARHLSAVLMDLEPEQLGLYWPVRGEFNAPGAFTADARFTTLAFALPFARRTPVELHYRTWDGKEPTLCDERGIASSAGRVVVPDVVLVPCVGYTRTGYRLGYGAGYFDRWLALHPDVTTIGVAWSLGNLDDRADAASFQPQPHDQPLTLIVTEHGVV